ncbi:unnamed protein product [Effrenium voratum]|nr:unnamed protein product [Effrenium voratum]
MLHPKMMSKYRGLGLRMADLAWMGCLATEAKTSGQAGMSQRSRCASVTMQPRSFCAIEKSMSMCNLKECGPSAPQLDQTCFTSNLVQKSLVTAKFHIVHSSAAAQLLSAS